ncbi:CdaR family protein [Brevibacillus ginsengisoli]|uniref:CdaR family protein n=1 Tax=Brevibacillus ginsengisoli TaxID=363854 RepID=UPI003CEEDC68
MDKWLNSHWFAKGIALLLACMMFLVVNLDRDPGTSTDVSQPTFIDGVNVKVIYDSDRYALVKQPKPVKVALESSNPFYRYNFVSPDQYEVYIDARGAGKGTHKLPVQHRGFPEDAKVGIIPSLAEITLEEKQNIEKQVQVELLGQVAPGYTTGEPVVKPFRVHVRVPESQINNVALVKASVNLDGATAPINTTVPLKVVDKSGNVIQKADVNPLTVEVSVPVTSPFVMVPIKLNLTNDLPAGYSLASVKVDPEEVTVYGPQEVLRSINTYSSPVIDLKDITSDRLLELKMDMLDKVVKVEPEYVKISLNVVPSQTKRIQNVPLRVTGLAPNLQAKVLTPDGKELTTLDFDVIGAPQNLQSLAPKDIQVLADVSTLPVGVHEVPLIYNLPNYLKTAPTAIKRVTVEITNKP